MLIDFQAVLKQEKTLIDLANEYSHADLCGDQRSPARLLFRLLPVRNLAKLARRRLIGEPKA